MHKTLALGIAAALGVSTAAATGAFAAGSSDGSAGAIFRWIQPNQTSGNNDECEPAANNANTGNGVTIVNAPGQPDSAIKVNGEISLKHATPTSGFTVYLGSPNSNGGDDCTMEGAIATNGQGNGNWHLDDPTLSSGTYFVVIRDASGQEQYATSPGSVR